MLHVMHLRPARHTRLNQMRLKVHGSLVMEGRPRTKVMKRRLLAFLYRYIAWLPEGSKRESFKVVARRVNVRIMPNSGLKIER